MKKNVYYHGEPLAKYGIWNRKVDGWQFGICEDTPMLAMARLYQKIGCEAKKYEVRRLPKAGLPESNYTVTLTEVRQRDIDVFADSLENAIDKIRLSYRYGIITLDSDDDFLDVDFKAIEKGDAK